MSLGALVAGLAACQPAPGEVGSATNAFLPLPVGAEAIALGLDGRIQVAPVLFSTDVDGNPIGHTNAWIASPPNAAVGWQNFAPGAASMNTQGQTEVFYVGNGGMEHLVTADDWSTPAYRDSWGNLPPGQGGLWGGPAAASWGYGRIDVFAFAAPSRRTLWHRYWENGSYSDWTQIASVPFGISWANGGLTATSWGKGRIDVFANEWGNQLFHAWTDDGVNFKSEELSFAIPLGKDAFFSGLPRVDSSGPDRLDLFVAAKTNSTWPSLEHVSWDGAHWTIEDLGRPPCNPGYASFDAFGAYARVPWVGGVPAVYGAMTCDSTKGDELFMTVPSPPGSTNWKSLGLLPDGAALGTWVPMRAP